MALFYSLTTKSHCTTYKLYCFSALHYLIKGVIHLYCQTRNTIKKYLGVRIYITHPPFFLTTLCANMYVPPPPSLFCSYLDSSGPECCDFRFILQPYLLLKGYNNSLSRLLGSNRENVSLLNFTYSYGTRVKLEGESISCYCIECQKQVGSVTGISLKVKMQFHIFYLDLLNSLKLFLVHWSRKYLVNPYMNNTMLVCAMFGTFVEKGI